MRVREAPLVAVAVLLVHVPLSFGNEAHLYPTAFPGPDRVVLVDEPVTFHGAGASPDDEIVEYAWDFESDGVQDSVSKQTGLATHRFTKPGDYSCLLTVKDSVGRTASDGCRIVVVAERVDADAARELLHVDRPVIRNAADGQTRRYAIMINGGYEDRFWVDVQLAYDMLMNGYGFAPEDIYLLNYNGTDPDGGNPNGMIDYSASISNLETVFSEVASRADEDDEVFIWVTDHGRGYSGPLSQGGQYLGYMDGKASVDPGDEPDFPESSFQLRSIFTGGDYRCNHGMNVWKVRRKNYGASGINFYRNKYVSQLDNVYIDELSTSVSDSDIYIERLVDYALGDTNRDGYIDTSIGEVFDYDEDGNEPYDPETGQFDEDDWGPVDVLQDDYNQTGGGLPDGAYPYKLFDEGFQGKICIDLNYTGGVPEVDGRDEDNAGLFDWMDVNQDGDTLDTVSVDELVCLGSGSSDLSDDALADMVNQLSVAKVTVVALPCFSGGLIEDLSAANRVICTATIEEAVSYGDIFIRAFVAALHGRDEDGAPVSADTDENGYVSMLEAFNYAAVSDYNDEIPQYDDNGDGVSQTDPVPAGGDGTFGSATYLCDIGCGRVATPEFTPDGGTYGSPCSVTIACATSDAAIYYTTDNSEPTRYSPEYTGPVLVDRRLILKAKAYKTGLLPSKVKTGVYFIPSDTVIHVTPDGDDGNDGLSWPDAKRTIAEAINAASSGDEIWIKGDLNSPYYECITVKAGVAILGGFAGHEVSSGDRPPFPRPAVDLNETIIDGNRLNSVVRTASGASAITVLDGLTIRNGYATYGGGIYCDKGSPTLVNCNVIGNESSYYGGGIYCAERSDPTVTSCVVADNTASSSGGGVHCGRSSSPTFNKCTIAGNSSGTWGGGIHCYSYSASLSSSAPTIANSTITDNSTGQDGGGVYARHTVLKMTNCTLSGNWSGYSGGGFCCQDSCPVITNSVLWGNATGYFGDQIKVENPYSSSQLTVAYSDVEDGAGGTYVEPNCTLTWVGTCIDADPLFVDPNGPDGDPDTWEDNDYHLSPNSPCIDSGDPNGDYAGQTDMDGQGRVCEIVDMGADEVWPPGWQALTLGIVGETRGTVLIDPNDPNWPAFTYPRGTVVTLTAEPNEGRSFKWWKIYDPNYPGDPNYMVTNTNNPMTIVMHTDQEIEAIFNCGSGAVPILPLMLGVAGLLAAHRRRH